MARSVHPSAGAAHAAVRQAGDAQPSTTGDNRGMDITLNGDRIEVAHDTTIGSLLAAQGLAERRVAVEVNGEIVPRSRHAEHALQQGDRVEIVHALGGG